MNEEQQRNLDALQRQYVKDTFGDVTRGEMEEDGDNANRQEVA